jgi:hypothetical protein
MSPEDRKRIASRGGRKAHELGKAHRFTSDEASAAGRKGGYGALTKLGRKHFSKLGRTGGLASAQSRRQKRVDAVTALVAADAVSGHG